MYRKVRRDSTQAAGDSANGSVVPPPVGERMLIDRYGHHHSERVRTTWSPALLKVMGVRPVTDAPHGNLAPELSEHSAVDRGGTVPQAGSEPVNDVKQGDKPMSPRKCHAHEEKKPTRPRSAPVPISYDPSFTTKPSRCQ
jgi:hypothetical protein